MPELLFHTIMLIAFFLSPPILFHDYSDWNMTGWLCWLVHITKMIQSLVWLPLELSQRFGLNSQSLKRLLFSCNNQKVCTFGQVAAAFLGQVSNPRTEGVLCMIEICFWQWKVSMNDEWDEKAMVGWGRQRCKVRKDLHLKCNILFSCSAFYLLTLL